MAKNFNDDYIKKHAKSKVLHDQALNSFTGDGATHVSRILDPFRPYITHAKGSRKWDVDGNEYIDYVMCHGGLILGHSHPSVVKAVQNQAAKGFHYGENTQLEIEWAELIKSMVTSAEKVEFFPCGNEANMMAVRLCRIFTGRKKMLRFTNHYHGWADELMASGTPGVLKQEHTTFIPQGDLKLVEKELSTGEYAIFFTEAGGASMGGKVPLDHDFVRQLPILANKYGTPWVLDEVVTGFRDAPGGWQSIVGVKPDLTTLGKCLGGGIGSGAIVGRSDIMSFFSAKTSPDKKVMHSGTWNANPLTAAAGIAACKLYKTGDPQKKANEIATVLRKDLNQLLHDRSISGSFYGRSIIHIYFGIEEFEPQNDTLPPTIDASKLLSPKVGQLCHHLLPRLLQRGVAIMGTLLVVSAAHTNKDVEVTVKAFGESLDDLLAEGILQKN